MGKLRLILAISVIVVHSTALFGSNLVGGVHAVHAFFMISGFYMSLILNEKYIGNNNSYKLFISNRFLRLYPLYLVVLVLSILVSVIIFCLSGGKDFGLLNSFYKDGHLLNWSSIALLITINLVVFGQDIVMFLANKGDGSGLHFTTNFRDSNPPVNNFLLIPQAWTLALELTFYLIAPFILRRSLKVVSLIILVSLALRYVAISKYGLNYDPWDNRFFLFEIAFFLLGGVAYRVYQKIRTYKISRLAYILINVYLFAIIIFFYQIPYKTGIFYLSVFLLIPWLFLYSKNLKFDKELGELSYPLYICHLMVIHCFKYFNISVSSLVVIPVAIFISYLLNRTIAERLEIFRQKRLALEKRFN